MKCYINKDRLFKILIEEFDEGYSYLEFFAMVIGIPVDELEKEFNNYQEQYYHIFTNGYKERAYQNWKNHDWSLETRDRIAEILEEDPVLMIEEFEYRFADEIEN